MRLTPVIELERRICRIDWGPSYRAPLIARRRAVAALTAFRSPFAEDAGRRNHNL